MHETTQALSWGTLTVNEYGNSIPFSFAVDALSEFDVREIIRGGLLDDAAKCIDGMVEREFNSCALRYVGSSTATYVLTTNGTATAVNTSVLNSYHLRNMVTELKKRNVPGYSSMNGDYAAVLSVEAHSSLSSALETVNSYTETGYKQLLTGEVGRYHGVRFVEDYFASRYTYSSTSRSATAKSWAQGKSLDAYVFGAGTVREAIVVPEEIRLKVVTDYGRSHGIAWYFLGGWVIEWADEPNARIIKWDSAS